METTQIAHFVDISACFLTIMTLPPSAEPFKDEYESPEKAGQAVSVIRTPDARILIQLVAPSNLPEGYLLEVESSGRQYVLVVVSMSAIAVLYI
jgi:hypothetical protein